MIVFYFMIRITIIIWIEFTTWYVTLVSFVQLGCVIGIYFMIHITIFTWTELTLTAPMLERAGANKFKLGQVLSIGQILFIRYFKSDSIYQTFQIRFHLSRRYITFRLSDILNQVPFIAQLHSIPFIRYFTSDSIYQAF